MSPEDFRLEVLIRPCPWCKRTGKFILDPDKETWMAQVMCKTPNCMVKPAARYVPIRKTSKTNLIRFKEKVFKALDHWNVNNPYMAYEKTIIYLSAIAHWFDSKESK